MLVLDCMYLGFIWLLVGFDVGFCVDLDVCSIRFLLRIFGFSCCFYVGFYLASMWLLFASMFFCGFEFRVLMWVLCGFYVCLISVLFSCKLGFMLHRCWLYFGFDLFLYVLCLAFFMLLLLIGFNCV